MIHSPKSLFQSWTNHVPTNSYIHFILYEHFVQFYTYPTQQSTRSTFLYHHTSIHTNLVNAGVFRLTRDLNSMYPTSVTLLIKQHQIMPKVPNRYPRRSSKDTSSRLSRKNTVKASRKLTIHLRRTANKTTGEKSSPDTAQSGKKCEYKWSFNFIIFEILTKLILSYLRRWW